jgi:hypothetical protein
MIKLILKLKLINPERVTKMMNKVIYLGVEWETDFSMNYELFKSYQELHPTQKIYIKNEGESFYVDIKKIKLIPVVRKKLVIVN